jgi:hypothetical protein
MRFRTSAACLAALLILASGCIRKKNIRMVAMGEKAEIGSFSYQAMETRWPMSLAGRPAKDRFLIVRVNIANTAQSEMTVPGFDVVDDSGNSVPELLDGNGVDDWLGVSRTLAVGGAQHGSIVFDVPPRHYRLRVADENDNFMYIDIPFNLSTEEPESKKVEGVAPLK